MDQTLRHRPLGAAGIEASHRAQAAQLNRRIVLVGIVVMVELAALTAALGAWAEGRMSDVLWILSLQAVTFLLAIGISAAPAVVPIRRLIHPSAEPVTAE
ncbi:MAG TPA: hypothetical protein VM754_12420 [Actinomycetota bacterium]|nr:hypothetical protein [Actinomycetota bacterium]